MIYTIIGSPGTGKGAVADYLAKEHGFQVIDIRERFYRGLPAEQVPSNKKEGIKLFYSPKCQDIVNELFEKAFYSTFQDWKQRTVIYPVTNLKQIELLRSRKFVYILGITAPTSLRYKNYLTKYDKDISLPEFLTFDDYVNFSPHSELSLGLTFADYVLHNNSTLPHLLTQLTATNFVDETLVRPNWDKYFMQIAILVSKRSNCFRRAVGAVMVKENRIIATGYNGAPFGIPNCNKGGCPRCIGTKVIGKDLDKCICIHAEENAVIEAGRGNAKGATIYTTTFPCLLCAKALVQAGIERVAYYKDYEAEVSKKLFASAKVKLERVDPFGLAPYMKIK